MGGAIFIPIYIKRKPFITIRYRLSAPKLIIIKGFLIFLLYQRILLLPSWEVIA